MMIIEMIGLPGCGKTYLANRMIKKGVADINVVDYERTAFVGKVKRKLREHLLVVLNKDVKKNIVVLKNAFSKRDNEEALFCDRDINYDINRIAILHHMYSNKKGRRIFDEGILQSFINIFVYFGLDCDEYTELISFFLADISVCYVQISAEDSFKSIRHRDRHVCAFDELGDASLLEFLTSFERNLEKLANKFSNVAVRRYDDVDGNIDRIVKELGI